MTTNMRPISAQYDELARLYGFEAVWGAMDDATRTDDDDEVTPEDRLGRVRDYLKWGRQVRGDWGTRPDLPDLRARLAEVNAALAGDAGDWRATLEKLKVRLETAIG